MNGQEKQKRCTQCGTTENLPPRPTSTYANPRTGRRTESYSCRSCNTARAKAYRATERGGARIRAAVQASKARYPEKDKARGKLANALRRGRVTRPDDCESCGAQAKLDAHHTDYSLPLDVTWLCRPCHAHIHHPVEQAA